MTIRTAPAENAAEKPCVLVVDDNRACAAMTSLILLEAGWDVETARDGFEAVVALQARRYSIVVLDYRLPGMDGVDVLKWMNRNLPRRPPVIFLSSDPPDQIAPLIAGLGAQAILTKPVVASELSRALGEIALTSG